MQTAATYNHTIAADECEENTELQDLGGAWGTGKWAGFALVESDGSVVISESDGDPFTWRIKCEDHRDLKYNVHDPNDQWLKTNRELGRKMVFIGGLSSELVKGSEPLGQDRYELNYGITSSDFRYDFETGIWSNDQGEKYKNGVRVE